MEKPLRKQEQLIRIDAKELGLTQEQIDEEFLNAVEDAHEAFSRPSYDKIRARQAIPYDAQSEWDLVESEANVNLSKRQVTISYNLQHITWDPKTGYERRECTKSFRVVLKPSSQALKKARDFQREQQRDKEESKANAKIFDDFAKRNIGTTIRISDLARLDDVTRRAVESQFFINDISTFRINDTGDSWTIETSRQKDDDDRLVGLYSLPKLV